MLGYVPRPVRLSIIGVLLLDLDGIQPPIHTTTMRRAYGLVTPRVQRIAKMAPKYSRANLVGTASGLIMLHK